ncbi:MAG TPA: hypothetical protein VJ921_02320 [Vicinamibacteria bacterium]|nr:hypothetical protein [Vicinamibacteria bacterium]
MALQLSTAAKARIALGGLAALLLWPPVHWRLVETHALDPWKFFGFAMYCRPSIPPSLDAWILVHGRRVEYPAQEWPADARLLLRRFLRDRQILGTWRSPNAVAHAILRARPDAEQVLLVVRHPRLESGTGLVGEREFRYGFARAP